MSERPGKRRRRSVYHPQGRSKPTCIIHGTMHSSDECKVMGDFGSNDDKRSPAKNRGDDPKTRNKFNRRKENNNIVNSAFDEILLQKNKF